MLDDYEQRALDDIERGFRTQAQEPDRHGLAAPAPRPKHVPGHRTSLVFGGISAVLFFAGAPTAGFALALATAIGWLFWIVVAHSRDDAGMPVLRWARGAERQDGADHRPGDSIRQYLKWLAEAE
jgi:alkanesulfonate monooxygenase SsuD/methylene tetrahydromethanopterin reductase-like flavin-dependent oxidoreductase (luciferase family)